MITMDVDTAEFASVYVQMRFTFSKQSRNCIISNSISDSVNWYGGPQQKIQNYPAQRLWVENLPYVTSYIDNAAIMERYWLASNDVFMLIDDDAPIFLDISTSSTSYYEICFAAKIELPYDIKLAESSFNYRVGIGTSVRATHLM